MSVTPPPFLEHVFVKDIIWIQKNYNDLKIYNKYKNFNIDEKKNPYYFDLVCCVMKKYLRWNIKKKIFKKWTALPAKQQRF